jgi:hypothetical protein
MSFLSPARSGHTNDNATGVPKPVKIARAIMWVQSIGLLVFGGLQFSAVMQLRAMSDKVLSKQTEALAEPWTTQADVPYTTLWVQVGILVVIGTALGVCALRLLSRNRSVYITAIAIESLVVLYTLLSLLSLNCMVVFGLPGVAVLFMLARLPGRAYFARDVTGDSGESPRPRH